MGSKSLNFDLLAITTTAILHLDKQRSNVGLTTYLWNNQMTCLY